MKKEISPEMYNYNKFPGPVFARVGDKVVAENIELDLVEDYREAFDQTVFGQRFSQLMLKFDYIVGDWGNDQLRLKGFYKDEKAVRNDTKIGHLEDYLLEFCNYGCPYFVLANANPIDLPVEPEDKPRSRRRNNRKKPRPATSGEKVEKGNATSSSNTQPKKQDKQKRRPRKPKQEKASESRAFVIRQK